MVISRGFESSRLPIHTGGKSLQNKREKRVLDHNLMWICTKKEHLVLNDVIWVNKKHEKYYI